MADTKTALTAERREVIAQLLEAAALAQTEFWDALRSLENEIGDCDELGTTDLEEYDVDSILELVAESQEEVK